MINKLLARLVRYLRQFYTDIEIKYWLNSEGKFIDGSGRAVTVDTALTDCVRSCMNQGIHKAHDYIPQFRKILKSRQKGTVFIEEGGFYYTIIIDFIRIG